MPIPQPEKKKHAPPSAGHRKKDFASLIARARARKRDRKARHDLKLARLKEKRGVDRPPTESSRYEKRLAEFGNRPRLATQNAV